MRKWSLIFFSALAILMAGCSKSAVETKGPVGTDDDAWMYDETLPVPVRFGISGTEVKASIEDASQMNGSPFGIFAFDKNAADLTEEDGLMLRNARAVGVYTGGKGSLGLANAYYYPQYSDRDFSFYSYYAYPTTSISYEVTASKALVTIPVSGIYDVLWAKSETDGNGYNARYIRERLGPSPSFNYKHATACLSFKTCLDEVKEGVQVKLTALYLIAPARATLCVTDRENATNEGTFVWKGDDVEMKAIPSGSSGNTGNLNLILTETPQSFCHDMFIVPGADVQKVKAVFEVRRDRGSGILGDGDDMTQKMNTTVVLRPGEEGKVFEAGYRYSFNISMQSPHEIHFELESADVMDSEGQDGQISVEGFKPAFQ